MSETHELKIRFVGPPAVAADTKRRLLGWLEERGITDVVDGVIDGIDEALDGAGELFGEADHSPVAVYVLDQAEADQLGDAIAAAFADAVAIALARLRDEAWQEAWDEASAVIETQRFIVVPDRSAKAQAEAAGRLALVIRPGAAFGSGRHATTKVALEALESSWALRTRTQSPEPQGFLDVGTGNGILAIAAARLGFDPLVGTEIDEGALAEARLNAADNEVVLELWQGAELPRDGRRYALVAANILAPVLHALMESLAQVLAPGGRLLLAGFIAKEEAPIVVRAQTHGLAVLDRRECRGWVGLVLGRDER